jgi:hypothetical protein
MKDSFMIYNRSTFHSQFFYLIPEDPVFGTWYYLSFFNFVFKVAPGTKCGQQIFKMFLKF